MRVLFWLCSSSEKWEWSYCIAHKSVQDGIQELKVKCALPLGQNYNAVHFVNKQLQKGNFFLAKFKWQMDAVLL